MQIDKHSKTILQFKWAFFMRKVKEDTAFEKALQALSHENQSITCGNVCITYA